MLYLYPAVLIESERSAFPCYFPSGSVWNQVHIDLPFPVHLFIVSGFSGFRKREPESFIVRPTSFNSFMRIPDDLKQSTFLEDALSLWLFFRRE